MTCVLGSTSLTTDADGNKISEMRYKPWGEVRYAWTATQTTTPAYELTRYTFTGQYSYMDDITTQNVTEGFGLMFYNARWYDPALGRFTSADTIIPSTQGVQAWDRFAYTNNNPLRYTDPTGHSCIPCLILIGAMVAGAVIDAGYNIHSQYKENGSIDAREVFDHAVEGAVIAGGIVIAATVVVAAASAIIPVACADGDCTNEAVATGATVSRVANATCGADCSDEITTLPARAIRFTQDTISPNTKAGVPLDTLTNEISNGYFKGFIRVTQYGGNFWSLDNRRLAAFKLLDADVPVKMVEFSEVTGEFAKKFTTITDGLSIAVKGTNLIIK